MAEALATGASVVAFVGLAGQVAQGVAYLYNFFSAIQDAPADVSSLAEELKVLNSTLDDIRRHGYETPSIKAALERCDACVEELKTLVAKSKLTTAPLKVKKIWSQMNVAFRSGEYRKYTERLERAKSALIPAQIDTIHDQRSKAETTILNSMSKLSLDHAVGVSRSSEASSRIEADLQNIPTHVANHVTREVSQLSQTVKDTHSSSKTLLTEIRNTSTRVEQQSNEINDAIRSLLRNSVISHIAAPLQPTLEKVVSDRIDAVKKDHQSTKHALDLPQHGPSNSRCPNVSPKVDLRQHTLLKQCFPDSPTYQVMAISGTQYPTPYPSSPPLPLHRPGSQPTPQHAVTPSKAYATMPYAKPPVYQPQSSASPLSTSALLSRGRTVLGETSANIQPSRALPSSPGGKILPQLYVLPADQYLSYHELERLYLPPGSDRLSWLRDVGLDIPIFQRTWRAEYKKQEVKDTWAEKSVVERRAIEVLAIYLRYEVLLDIDSLPLRDVPLDALPLAFSMLEGKYFNLPERKLADYQDTITKRSAWVKELKLLEPAYHVFSPSPEHQVMVETVYNRLSVTSRRTIEARAQYLKMLLSPPKPTWANFEADYGLHDSKMFSSTKDFEMKRREWLRSIGLDKDPFIYLPSRTTELGQAMREWIEVAWNDLGLESRERFIKNAEQFQSQWISTWAKVAKEHLRETLLAERATKAAARPKKATAKSKKGEKTASRSRARGRRSYGPPNGY